MNVRKAIGTRTKKVTARRRTCTWDTKSIYRRIFFIKLERWLWVERLGVWIDEDYHDWKWWGDSYYHTVMEKGIPF